MAICIQLSSTLLFILFLQSLHLYSFLNPDFLKAWDPAFIYIKYYAYKCSYLWEKSGRGHTGLPHNSDHLLFSSTNLQGRLIYTIDELPDNPTSSFTVSQSIAGEPATTLGTIHLLQTQGKKKTNVTSLGTRPYSHPFLTSGELRRDEKLRRNILKDPFHT